MTAVPSRWGFHPCDYVTFRLLKKLHGFYWRALRQHAAWQRWARKKPHNRVIRHKIRNEEGHVVRREVVGPMPEPVLCPVFCVRDKIKTHVDEEGNYLPEGRFVDRVTFRGHGIPEAYHSARTPRPQAELVTALPLSTDEIHRLAAEAERWYADR
jgi:hypothetical protein